MAWSQGTMEVRRMPDIQGTRGIIGLDHIGIAVKSLDKAIAWYENTLNAQLILRETNSSQLVNEAIMRVGTSNIQLLEPINEASTIAKFIDRRGEGVQQIAFEVRNLQLAVQDAEKIGIRKIFQTNIQGSSGSMVNFLHPSDCGGILIELVQRDKNVPNSR